MITYTGFLSCEAAKVRRRRCAI